MSGQAGRPARTEPRPHGWVKYKREGCRCDVCTTDARAQERRRAYLRDTGRSLYVDAAPVRTHVHTLVAAGMSYPQIGALAGVDRTVVRVLVDGHRGKQPSRRVRRTTADAVLRVQAAPAATAEGVTTEATGSRRRLRALVALGYGQTLLCQRLGLGRSTVDRIITLDHNGRLRASTVEAIRALYAELQDQPGPSSAARRRAAERGWLAPGYWDDETIDDPFYSPALDEPVVDDVAVARALAGETVRLTREERAEAARQLLAQGHGPGIVADRLRLNGQTARDLVDQVAS